MTDPIEVWPGRAYPLGATYDGAGTNFSLFSEVAERVELCLFDDDGTETRSTCDEVDAFVLARLPARQSAPASATATGSTGPGRPTEGLRCNPAKLLLDPYARRSTARSTGTRPCFALRLRRPDGSRNDADSAPFVPRCGRGRPVLRLGRRPPAATPLHETVIYETHVKGFTKRHPGHPRGAARHLRRPRPPGGDRPPDRPRRHRGRAAAGAPVRPRRAPRRPGPAQLLGLQLDRLLRAAQRLRRGRRRAASRSQSSRRWCKALHDAGIEVILDVVYNHTAEGNHLGPDAVVQGHRQRRRTTGWSPDDRRYYFDTPAPATASTSATRTRCS